MLTAMVIVFLVGYLMIALEHPLKINKAGTALLIGTILWVMYTYAAPFFIRGPRQRNSACSWNRSPLWGL